jgi:cysteine-rich repeat protein
MSFLGCENLNPCVTSCSLNGINPNQVDLNLNNCSIDPGGNLVLGEVRLRLDSLASLPPDATKFFMGGRATYRGSAGTCIAGECDNAESGHICTNDEACNWSLLTADASGSADILLPICGDGIIDAPEETCDPPGEPAGGNGNLCRNDCTVCGDGEINGNEQCDDGNGINGDGCNNNCEEETCDVLVDKIIDCGEGTVDVGLVINNEDGTNGCSTTNGEPITVTYQVENTGEVPLANCVLIDSNGLIIPELLPGVIIPGVTVTVGTVDPLTCSDTLDAEEPDTVTVDCDCIEPENPLGTVSASDSARITCEPICGDGNIDPGETCDADPGVPLPPTGNACRQPGEEGECTYCGDGEVQQVLEECDDGNDINDDACSNSCQLVQVPCIEVTKDRTRLSISRCLMTWGQ